MNNKKDILMKNGTYNKNHEKVTAPKFFEDTFYDPMDIAQVKYEMLKDVEKKETTVADAASDYGFSRAAFYNIKEAFNKQGIKGLIPDKPGPRKPHKMTQECQELIDGYVAENPRISSSEITERIKHDNDIQMSKRTVERYRAKKKQQ